MGDSVELMIGRIEGKMSGISKEITEIKTMIKCQSEDCTNCRSEIDDRETALGQRIDAVAAQHTGEQAVRSWLDNNLVRLGILIGALCGVVAAAKEFWPYG
jgi:hypothetical protein